MVKSSNKQYVLEWPLTKPDERSLYASIRLSYSFVQTSFQLNIDPYFFEDADELTEAFHEAWENVYSSNTFLQDSAAHISWVTKVWLEGFIPGTFFSLGQTSFGSSDSSIWALLTAFNGLQEKKMMNVVLAAFPG